jgi:hypothetical protein
MREKAIVVEKGHRGGYKIWCFDSTSCVATSHCAKSAVNKKQYLLLAVTKPSRTEIRERGNHEIV